MKTIKHLMTFSEMRELSTIRIDRFKEIEAIITKPFEQVTVGELILLSKTDIFDAHFVEAVFSDLFDRYNK